MQEEQDYYSMQMESILEDLEGELEVDESQEDQSAIQEPNIAQLEDNLYRADERQQELVNIQEMLTEAGGVSRAMAENFKELLPPEMAMESFTAQVTRTNHVMCTEFIGTAIALVAMTGVLAVLGSVGYVVYRIMKFRKRLPNAMMDKKITAMVNTVEDKLRTAITELRHLFPDITHQDFSWNRQDGLIQSAIAVGCQEIDVVMLSGQYKGLADVAAVDCSTQAKGIEKFFVSGIFPELDKMMRAGSNKDVDNVTKKLQEYQLEDLVSKHLERLGHDRHLSFTNSEEVCVKFRDRYTQPVSATEIPGRLGGVKINASAMNEEPVQTMFKAQAIMIGLASRIQQYEKRIDGSKELPKEYLAEVKGLLQKCKGPLGSLADVFTIVEVEVGSHKRCAKIKAGAVSNGFKSVSGYYQEQAQTDKENARQYRACVQHLKKLFDPIAAALR